MEFAKPGEIQKFCLPNSILSFKEYLLDYGDEELRQTGDELIRSQTASIEDTKIRNSTIKKLEEIEEGRETFIFDLLQVLCLMPAWCLTFIFSLL